MAIASIANQAMVRTIARISVGRETERVSGLSGISDWLDMMSIFFKCTCEPELTIGARKLARCEVCHLSELMTGQLSSRCGECQPASLNQNRTSSFKEMRLCCFRPSSDGGHRVLQD